MIEQLNQAVEQYHTKWHALVAACQNKTFFEDLQPTAVGWKVEDRVAYDQQLAELQDDCAQIYSVWMNGRWIAKLVLREALPCGIRIVKLMERRPRSSDPVGLDHLDFYTAADIEPVLASEPGLNWTHETNNALTGHSWLSIWFDGTEAKLRNETVLDVCVAELQQANKRIIS